MNFQKKILKNGIAVVMEKRNLPIVSLSIANKFGAAYETSDIKGIAHFIEHLVFTGTKSRMHGEISKEVEKRGGILNAFTSHEITSFWFKLPHLHLFSGLEILADILKDTSFIPEKFEKEKKVILEEIKMYHDNPAIAVYEQIEKNLFENPFGESVIGSKKTIVSLKRDFVKSYFFKNYSPENFIVSIVGSADFEKVCEYLEKNFSANNKKFQIFPIKKKNAHTKETREGIDQAHFVFGVHAPLYLEKDFPALRVLDTYLANGMSSHLFLEIREKRGLAYAITSSIEAEKNYSYYTIYVGTKKEALEEVKNLILEGFEKMQAMTEKELEEAKTRITGLKNITSEESINVMNALMFAELNGNAEKYYEYEKEINEVTLEQVKNLAKQLIKNYSTAIIMPK